MSFNRLTRLVQSIVILLACTIISAVPVPELIAPASSAAVDSPINRTSAVCTPNECLMGVNALVAGIHTSTQLNGSTLTATLLPGSYSSTPSISSSNVLSTYFSPNMVLNPSIGFASTGSEASSINVVLLAGIISYSNTLYQGIPNYSPLSSINSTTSLPSTNSSSTPSSLLISSGAFVILSSPTSPHSVIYDSIPDISQLPSNVVGSSGVGVTLRLVQSSMCVGGCSSGGICGSEGKCICSNGFTGDSCNRCLPNHFGKSCLPCALLNGCSICDDGVSGTGRCLSSSNSTTDSSSCNCANGLCSASTSASAASSSIFMNTTLSSSSCACNAGWTTASNGTSCAACSLGYFMNSIGECLACDPSCSTCSSPSGTCLNCQPTLIPLSTSPTKCVTSPARLTSSTNNTFITCPARTFFNNPTSSCVACDPLCETCYGSGSKTCLSCRTGTGLLNSVCVAVDARSGVCDSNGASGGWVFDNAKGVCDALPPKCTTGSIDNFNPTSTRSALRCSACLPGTYLVGGNCMLSCPTGFVAVGNSCVPCDSSCSSCSITPKYCTTCASTSQLSLAGNCINGPTCPARFFLGSNSSPPSNSTAPPVTGSTCSPCHPDCATCGTTFDNCLSCSTSRPYLLTSSPSSTNATPSSTCKLTCPSSNQYYDAKSSSCVTCDPSCSTCSASGPSSCTSCAASSSLRLKSGSCVNSGCTVIPRFNVCLSDLVTVSAPASSTPTKSAIVFPWYFILLIVLLVLLLALGIFLWWRKREQEKRKLTTAKFANGLDKKEVELKLKEMKLDDYRNSQRRIREREEQRRIDDAEVMEDFRERDQKGVTFVIGEDSPTIASFPFSESHALPNNIAQDAERRKEISRWSDSTAATRLWRSKSKSTPLPLPPPLPLPVFRLLAQSTGASQYSVATTSSSERNWNTKNPFNHA